VGTKGGGRDHNSHADSVVGWTHNTCTEQAGLYPFWLHRVESLEVGRAPVLCRTVGRNHNSHAHTVVGSMRESPSSSFSMLHLVAAADGAVGRVSVRVVAVSICAPCPAVPFWQGGANSLRVSHISLHRVAAGSVVWSGVSMGVLRCDPRGVLLVLMAGSLWELQYSVAGHCPSPGCNQEMNSMLPCFTALPLDALSLKSPPFMLGWCVWCCVGFEVASVRENPSRGACTRWWIIMLQSLV
jgi:hypothetical protein